jgi:hypothetical protein
MLVAPADILLSSAAIAENLGSGSLVGAFTSVDADAGDSFTYSFASDGGPNDNASFTIQGGELRSAATFDFEAKPVYSIRVRSTDSGGDSVEKVFSITVTDVAESSEPSTSPSGIPLTTDPSRAWLHSSGPGASGNHTAYPTSLASLTGLTVHGYARSSQDPGWTGWFVQPAAQERTYYVYEVFVRSAFDQTVSWGSGGDDGHAVFVNGAFVAGGGFGVNVSGSLALTAGVPVQLTLVGSNAYGDTHVSFITAGDVALEDVPGISISPLATGVPQTTLSLDGTTIPENAPAGTAVGTLAAADPEAAETFTYALVPGAGDADNASFTIQGGELRSAATFDFEAKPVYSIRVRSTDSGGDSVEKAFSITVTDVAEVPTEVGLLKTERLAILADAGVGTLSSRMQGWGNPDWLTSLDGDRIVSYAAGGSGIVRVWQLGASYSLSRVRDIAAPDAVYDHPTHGISIVTDGRFLGVGSSLTWIGGAHDGAFYTYDLSSGARIARFNPQPHWAQYFGTYASISREGNFFVVGEEGNSGWITSAAITVYAYDPVTLTATQIGRQTFSSAWSHHHAAPVAAGDTLIAAYRLGVEQRYELRMWKVTTDATGRATGIVAKSSFPGALDSWVTTAASTGVIATDGTTVAMANPEVAGGAIELFRDDDAGTLVHVGSIASPTPSTVGFGRSMVFDGHRLLVGAPEEDVGRAGKGCVYAYEIGADGTARIVERIVPDSLASAERFGGALSLSEGRLLVSAGPDSAYLFGPSVVGGASVPENAPPGAVVGSLAGSDPDTGDTLTFSLVAGDGGTDNASFEIVGNTLRTRAVFDHESKGFLSVRIRATDQHGLFLEKVFTITIEDVLDEPTTWRTGDVFAALAATYGSVSGVSSTTVEGLFLTGDVTATAPSGFQVSSDGVGWGQTAVFPATAGAFSGTLRVRLAATAQAGNHSGSVTLSGGGAADLAIALPAGTIAKKTLTIQAGDQTRPYGRTNPSNTATITGFVNGDDRSAVTGTPGFTVAATAASDVGAYAIVPTAGSLTAKNYAFTDLRPGSLTVTRAAVTVTADDLQKVAGDADPVLSYSAAGFYVTAASPLSSQLTGSLVRDAGSAAGTYAIRRGALALAAAAEHNYDLTFVPGTLSIVAAPRLFVSGAFAKGSAWTGDYLGLAPFTTTGAGSKLGFPLAGGSAQLENASELTWTNVNTISLRFSEAVNLPATSALALVGVTNSSTAAGKGTQITVVPSSVKLLDGGTVVQWTLPQSLASGKWQLVLADGAITSASGGRALDGEWTDASTTFAVGSGDGTVGGAFRYRFNVLVGDVAPASGTSATAVDTTDVNAVKAVQGQSGTAANHRANVNGDATINATDLALVTAEKGKTTLANLGDFVPVLVPATGATVDGPFTVSFVDDPAWRGAIAGIKVNGTALPTAAYAITAGAITFDPSKSTLLRSVGTKTITIDATGQASNAVSQPLAAGAAAALVLVTQPSGPATSGGVLSTSPVVRIVDKYGNVVGATVTITAVVETGTGSWTLGGATSVATTAGTATFSNLRATNAGVTTVTAARIRFGVTLGGVTLTLLSNTFTIPA